MIVHNPVPAYVTALLGAGDRGCGGGFLPLMMTTASFRAQLKSLQLIYVLPNRRVTVMVATTADDMGAVGFMDGGLGALRL
jgi:hypothetical protein